MGVMGGLAKTRAGTRPTGLGLELCQGNANSPAWTNGLAMAMMAIASKRFMAVLLIRQIFPDWSEERSSVRSDLSDEEKGGDSEGRAPAPAGYSENAVRNYGLVLSGLQQYCVGSL